MTTMVSFKMDDKYVKYLKKMSHYFSIERDVDLSFSDLIREAVEATYPMPVENQGEKQDNGSQCMQS